MIPTVFLLFLGLGVGSFLNVLIDRLPNNESIVYPPSHCDYCKKKLLWQDLIPVFSFLMLGGRCRYCQKNLRWYYPVVEFLTGLLFVGTYVVFFPSGIMEYITVIYYLFIIASLIVVFFSDLKYGIIPDKVVFPSILVAFLYIFLNHTSLILNHSLSALGAFLFFLAIFLLTGGGGMGFADVKLSFLLGLFFGFPNIVLVLYIAFLTGAAFSIILILLGRKRLKETIAFGPFLVLASLVFLFSQNKIVSLWLWFLPVVLP